MKDFWKDHREESQKRRKNNREQSAQYLQSLNIPFTSNNDGAHLVVGGTDCFIDFWPGTGKWITRDGKTGYGVKNLAELILGPRPR